MEDLLRIGEGVLALCVAYLAHTWALAYPIVTGTTALLALVVMLYNISRLLWRWRHGYPNFLTDQEVENLRERDEQDDALGCIPFAGPRSDNDLVCTGTHRPGDPAG